MTRLSERLADLAGNALPRAHVTKVERLSPRFTRVTLAAGSFRKASWIPGARLQLRTQSGSLAFRTYTPIGWDNERGTTELLAFTHGDGPAARWFGQVQVGTTCHVFGPRRSIDLTGMTGPVVFVGDESSVALACALRTVADDVSYLFESRDPAGLEQILAGLGLTERVTVIAKDADLLSLARGAAVDRPYTVVVTGDAATVHAVRRDTRGWPRRPAQLTGKAYWAEGRTGLD
jgi:ferric-chelate reductase (NADPH)